MKKCENCGKDSCQGHRCTDGYTIKNRKLPVPTKLEGNTYAREMIGDSFIIIKSGLQPSRNVDGKIISGEYYRANYFEELNSIKDNLKKLKSTSDLPI